MIAICVMSDTPVRPTSKPPRGSWHEQARVMRAELGLTYDEIGYRLGVSGPAVYFALNPGRRKGRKAKEAAVVAAAPTSP